MIISNCLDYYDLMMAELFRSKFGEIVGKDRCNFIYAPSSLSFIYARESFGEKFFPLYSIYRSTPPMATNDYTTYANQFKNIRMNDEYIINHLVVELKYEVSFFSDDMADMNKSVIEYYYFKSSPSMVINLKDIVGFDWEYRFECKLDAIEESNNIDSMFEGGLYFRYTYPITCRLLLVKSKLFPIEFKNISIVFINKLGDKKFNKIGGITLNGVDK